MGFAVALGGSVEYQKNDNPHFHGNVHLATIYQCTTLHEMAALIRNRLVDMQAIVAFQSWVCREEHVYKDQHVKARKHLEESWKENNRSREHDALCMCPAYLRTRNTASPWSTSSPLQEAEARADGDNFKNAY